jgi:hypothetical protein
MRPKITAVYVFEIFQSIIFYRLKYFKTSQQLLCKKVEVFFFFNWPTEVIVEADRLFCSFYYNVMGKT